jgi:alpha-galactosidase
MRHSQAVIKVTFAGLGSISLPPQLTALNRTFLNELTVRGALDESRDHVYQAAPRDPNTAATLTTSETVAMCDDLLAAHRDLLPPSLR